MKALSIEEIKQLELGDEIWLSSVTGHLGRYVTKDYIPNKDKDTIFKAHNFPFSHTYPYSDYGKTWVAYKNKEQAECKGELIDKNKVIKFIEELAWKDVQYDAFQSVMDTSKASLTAIPRYAKKYFDLWKELFDEKLK